ncbi:DUF4197 domain-containing protein [Teredinibacter haidensis]|uniref:DUF4197 domain-containing protein n=1 Tax=Teredinibacter haidensis TaxID=2731755 RepID=UPI000948BE19|nr:DUF4197 domain-containing protein [Teredinibacter haidensis]
MMNRKLLSLVLLATLSTGCEHLPQIIETGAAISQSAGVNPTQLSDGIKQALELSTGRASDLLSQSGGYSDSSEFHIGLPPSVQSVTNTMKKYGLAKQVDQAESLMNRGAELAAGEAKAVFIDAVKQMSVDDAMGIIRGGDTAATDYFRAQTQGQLLERYRPIMQGQLQKLGFYEQYQSLLSGYKLLPMANKPNLDLEEYAINQGVTALFTQIAREEQKIRANPVEQGTALISAVFGEK